MSRASESATSPAREASARATGPGPIPRGAGPVGTWLAILAAALIARLAFVHEAEEVAFHVFRVDAWTGDPVLADDEHTVLRWFTVEEAAALPDLAAGEYAALFRSL